MSGNEGRACDAVLRVLERRSGETRSEVRRPERDGIGPPVDLRARLGAQECAFEHSLIEPFEGAVRTGILFSRLLDPVHREVDGRLPGPAWYWLSLPLDPSLGAPGRELRSSQRVLSEWILSEAGELYRRSLAVLERDSFPRDFQASVEADLPGFPYPVKMSCDARRLRGRREEGQLFPARIAPRMTGSNANARSESEEPSRTSVRSSRSAATRVLEPYSSSRATTSPCPIVCLSAMHLRVRWASGRTPRTRSTWSRRISTSGWSTR